MGVRVVKLVQNPRDFIVSFPQAYHMGFSFGYRTLRPPGSSHGLPPRLPPLGAAHGRYRCAPIREYAACCLRHKLHCAATQAALRAA